MVAIAEGRPQQMGLLKMISYYVGYQREVVLRRSKFELDEAKEREHILKGLVIAVRNIDEVVAIIKKSGSPSEAKTALRIRFDLSDRQAQAILDLRLAKLTSLEIYKLETELAELEKRIAWLTQVVGSKKMQLDLVKTEMLEIKKKYKDPRRSVIIGVAEEYEIPSAAGGSDRPIEEVFVSISENGFIKGMTAKYFAGATKTFGERSNLNEVYKQILKTATDKQILVFTNLGNAFKINVSSIPECKWKEKGAAFSDLVPAKSNEKPVALIEITDPMPEGFMLFFTKQGMIKKTAYSEYTLQKSAYQAIKLKDGDELVSIEPDAGDKDTTIVCVTKFGMVLNALKNDIPEQGRVAGGVKGIMMADDDELVLISQIKKGVNLIAITDKAYAKRVNICEIDPMARYRKGVKLYELKPNTTGSAIVGAFVETDRAEIIVVTSENEFEAINLESIPEDTRGSKGKRLSLDGIDLIAAYYRRLS